MRRYGAVCKGRRREFERSDTRQDSEGTYAVRTLAVKRFIITSRMKPTHEGICEGIEGICEGVFGESPFFAPD